MVLVIPRGFNGAGWLALARALHSVIGNGEVSGSASSLLPDPLRDPTIPSKPPTSKDLRHSTSVCRAETLGVNALAPTELFTAVGGEIDEKLGSNSIKTFYGGSHIGALGVWSSAIWCKSEGSSVPLCGNRLKACWRKRV